MGVIIALIVLFILFLLFGSGSPTESSESVLNRSHPTDDEYLRQMGPEIPRDIALKVRRIIVDVNGWEIDEIWPDMTLAELLD